MVLHPRRCLVRSALAVSVAAVALAGCTSGGKSVLPTTVPTVSSTTAAPTTTTTTMAVPPAPQPSPAAAAAAFIQAWKKNDMAAAARVATASAIAALFATPYTNQTVQSRGCSVEFVPRVCSYGPFAGGSGALYEIDLMPVGSDWYVSNAMVET
jgi:hypothetical protein